MGCSAELEQIPEINCIFYNCVKGKKVPNCLKCPEYPCKLHVGVSGLYCPLYITTSMRRLSEMPTTVEMLEEVLTDLKRTGDIEVSAIISRDGVLVTSDIPKSVYTEAFAAMSASMVGSAEAAIAELRKGVPDRTIVESKKGKVIAIGAGSKALLVVMTSPEVELGLILIEMEKAANKIRELL